MCSELTRHIERFNNSHRPQKLPMLETVRKRLRALVKLIPKEQKKIVDTNFEDESGELTEV